MRIAPASLAAVATLGLLAACSTRPGAALVGAPAQMRDVRLLAGIPQRDSVRMVLLGDTGEETDARDSVVNAVRREGADLVLILGDLVYPHGPTCRDGVLTAAARTTLDEQIGKPFGNLGVPVLLVLGNHDVERRKLLAIRQARVDQEACYYLYAREKSAQRLILPSRHYGLTIGPATLSLITSTGKYLDGDAADLTKQLFGQRDDDWNLLATHHVYRTFDDKASESHLRTWLRERDIHPDLVLNGHAHFIQMGSYDSVLAVTSGGSAKQRAQQRCALGDPSSGTCREGEYFGYEHSYGYAVLDVTRTHARVRFSDKLGTPLWACRSRRGSGSCEPEPATR